MLRRAINEIQRVGFDVVGIILNAAAYAHTSVGIGCDQSDCSTSD